MHGEEAGPFTPLETGFPRLQYAQPRAGQAEPWQPDTPQLFRMNCYWLNLGDFGVSESAVWAECHLKCQINVCWDETPPT